MNEYPNPAERLERLASNNDGVKSGQNNRRVARIREYDARIANLVSVENEASAARDLINNGVIPGQIIPGELRKRCIKIMEDTRREILRLEYERSLIMKAVQR